MSFADCISQEGKISTLNESVSRVRELLADPKEQNPTVKRVFGAVLREFQNFVNALSNSSQPFTIREVPLTLSTNQTDYLIGNDDGGKVLFVTANDGTSTPPYFYPVEFTDLYDTSTYWWYYYPIVAARPEDYNFTAYSTRVAFYRKDGNLWARIPLYYGNGNLTITLSTGNWVNNIDIEQSAVLTNHHHLVELRAAMNLCPSSRWSDDKDSDRQYGADLFQNLRFQEERAKAEFDLAKRGLTQPDVAYIETNDWAF